MSGPRILAVFAHPDDESLLAGGTLAACADRGCHVDLVCATGGELGPSPDADGAALGERREAELLAAARVLGIHCVECLGHPDGELEWSTELENDVTSHLRRGRPDMVITFGPEGLYWHPDHIAVHRATGAALRSLASEGFTPWLYHVTWPEGRMRELVSAARARGAPSGTWGLDPDSFGAPPETITTVVDVRAVLDRKLRAIRCHRSQLGSDHLLSGLPRELAEELLGDEYFVRAAPPDAGRDPLPSLASLSAAAAQPSEA
jgi:N-acetyl-1-D-myo-inositol-2-amino-2-deoxy-alpha-D-glucopyranoside deacetylase